MFRYPFLRYLKPASVSVLLLICAELQANEPDVNLTPILDVKTSLKTVFADAKLDVDRISMSEMFVVNSPDRTFLVDATGHAIMETGSVRYVGEGVIKNLHYGNKKQQNLSEFYQFASSGVFPMFGTSDAKPIVALLDPTCPNSTRFHQSTMNTLVYQGNNFIYVPSLRDITSKRARSALISAYCAAGQTQLSQVQALYSNYRLYRDAQIKQSSCSALLERVISSSIDTFVRQKMLGSPAFLMPDGEVVYGAKALSARM